MTYRVAAGRVSGIVCLFREFTDRFLQEGRRPVCLHPTGTAAFHKCNTISLFTECPQAGIARYARSRRTSTGKEARKRDSKIEIPLAGANALQALERLCRRLRRKLRQCPVDRRPPLCRHRRRGVVCKVLR